MKIKIILFLMLICTEVISAKSPSVVLKEKTVDELVHCNRIIFETEPLETGEKIFCYNEYNGSFYARIIGVKNNSIIRNIQIPVKNEADNSPYYNIKNNQLEYLITDIKETKEYHINLQNNEYEILPYDEDRYYKFPFNEKYISINENKWIRYEKNIKKSSDSKTEGDIKLQDKYYLFEEKQSNENEVILFTELLNTKFLTVLQTQKSSDYKYGDKEEKYSSTNSYIYKSKPELKPFAVQKVNAFISETTRNSEVIEYKPEKYFSLTENPWAVTKTENKKSILLKLNPSVKKNVNVRHLIIANGFTTKEKLYLYEQNSRVKNIRISYGNNHLETQLKDDSNFQIVSLNDTINQNDIIEIEIIDSYEGTKYSDIVISGIYYFYAETE